MSVQVPVPDERMLNCIVKLKCMRNNVLYLFIVDINMLVKDHDLRVLYSKFLKCDTEVIIFFVSYRL